MRTTSILLVVLVIAFLAMLGLTKSVVRNASPTAVVKAVGEDTPLHKETAPTPNRTERARGEAVPPQLVAIDGDGGGDWNTAPLEGEGVVNDPVEIAELLKEAKRMDLRYLESSPAKDTPEAKQIEAMLAVRGISRAAVPACYNIAWNYQHMLRMTGNHEDAMSWIQSDKSRIQPYGVVDNAFWEQLVAIKPAVFFGHADYRSPRPGEPILTE